MSRSQETFNKKEVRNRKEKKRKEKEKRRLAKKEGGKSSLDDMIAYVDENGMITSTPPDPNKKSDVKLEDIEVSVSQREDDEDQDTSRKGTLTYFNDSKGYGFIKDKVSKESVFVHINNIEGEVKEGNLVSFEVGKGPKGPTALNVKKI